MADDAKVHTDSGGDDDDALNEPSRLRVFFREWIKPFLLAILIVTPFRSSLADYYEVPTGSMKPSILEGDRIFVDKRAYDLRIPFTGIQVSHHADPVRGDIVVCLSPRDGVRLVKRVVGVPGDTIELVDNRLIINGERVAYRPLGTSKHTGLPDPSGLPQTEVVEQLPGRTHRLLWTPSRFSSSSFGPVEVPRGAYLMLGDNRDNSGDSRAFGFVRRDQILGRATGIIYSLDPRETLAPRWKRFLSALK